MLKQVIEEQEKDNLRIERKKNKNILNVYNTKSINVEFNKIKQKS